MRKNHYCLSLFAAILLFSSCRVNHYLYAPVAPQAPMLNHQGEMNITGLYSGSMSSSEDSDRNNGYDIQAAYAISNHLAVTGAFSHRNERDVYKNANPYPFTLSSAKFPAIVWYTRNTTQFGLGYFTPIDRRNNAFFDLYGGYGFAKYKLHETGIGYTGNYDLYHTTSVAQFYLQPGLHFNGPGTSAGLSLRFTAANYYHIMSDYPALLEDTLHMATIRNTVFAFMEPSFTFRFWIPRVPWVKLETQMSTSIKLNDKAFNYRKSYFSVGLSFDLSKLGDQGNYNYKTRKKTNKR